MQTQNHCKEYYVKLKDSPSILELKIYINVIDNFRFMDSEGL